MSNMWFSFSWKYKRSPTYLKMLQQSEYLEKPNRGKYKKTLQTLTVCSCHVTYEFQSESTLYSCLNVRELLARSRREIWSLSDCNFLPVSPNGWVFVYELSGSGFESSCSHLNFRFRSCFEQGVPWHSGNYRVWIHSEHTVRYRNVWMKKMENHQSW